MKIGQKISVAFGLFISTPILAQVPAPPPMAGQDEMAKKLVAVIEGKDVKGYANLLEDDLHVYQDGKEIAKSKIEWLGLFGRKLSTPGVFFKIEYGFSSIGRILFIEYFNSMESWGGTSPAHCCWSYDAISYSIAPSGKIGTIMRLRGGGQKIVESSRIEK